MIFLCLFISVIRADIPSYCEPDTWAGTWKFYVGEVVDRMYNCSSLPIDKIVVGKNFSVDISVDADKSHNVYSDGSLVGYWSSMSVEGFDVFIDNLHYQAYFNFTESFDEDANQTCFLTNCSQTLGGWVRENVIHPDEFRCFYAERTNPPVVENVTCEVYALEEMEMYTNNRLHRIGKRYKKPSRTRLIPTKALASRSGKGITVPEALDWSNYNGFNYVNPVYDQEWCGSCFSFGSLAALEARILIQSNRTVDLSISQQDIVSCSHYSQGCDGGYELEVGYWVKDHGIVDNKCFPYAHYYPQRPYAREVPACSQRCNVVDADKNNDAGSAYNATSAGSLTYLSHVEYIGGYLGACTEQLMLEALQDGPIPVGIAASADEFGDPKPGEIIDSAYDGSIDHSVLLVGYGEEGGKKFWKIKNSWGANWGDGGFARVLRGNNTLSIEKEATVLYPVPFTPPQPIGPTTNDTNDRSPKEKKLFISTIALAVALGVVFIVCTVCTVLYCCKNKGESEGSYRIVNS